MEKIKRMYHSILKDPFPREMHITVGDQELIYKKKTWIIDEEKGLRYGENPDQPAALYELCQGKLELGGVNFRMPSKNYHLVSSITEKDMIQAGKHPGKINLTDIDNGINILQYLTAKKSCVILKHNNPCGAAWSDVSVEDAIEKAYFSDRIAAFGGTLVTNSPITKEAAEFISKYYFEVIAAPEYEQGSIDLLRQRKNLRILRISGLAQLEKLVNEPFLDVKSLVDGGLILQFSFRNRILSKEDFLPAEATKDGKTIIARTPTDKEFEDLIFAWAVEAGVTSNSVLFAKNGVTVAIGTGEQDRVGCVDLTIHKAYVKYADKLAYEKTSLSFYELRQKARKEDKYKDILEEINHKVQEDKGGLQGSVMVSDGFFPFRDGVDLAIEQGVTAIAQPGGSLNDFEVIEAVNEATPQVAMVFTGQRSFKH